MEEREKGGGYGKESERRRAETEAGTDERTGEHKAGDRGDEVCSHSV